MSNEGDDVNFLDVLGQMSAALCPHCGETTSAYAEVCEACGGSLGIESDDPSLNVTDGSGSHHMGLNKVAMHESKNLIRLREALRGLSDSSLSAEDYAAVVEEVLAVVDSALELYASPYFQHRVANMDPEPAEVYRQLAVAATEMQAGLHGMLEHGEVHNLAEAEASLKKVEAGLWKVDAAQDVAISKASTLVEVGEP